jgi:hypothetical protein
MALNKDVLGTALYSKAQSFNDRDIDNIDQARRDFWKAVAEEIVNHIKSSASLNVPGTGLVAPSGGGPVTGISTTGTIL